ncbi:hypothetical protein SmJEL517_g01472 [Synchytrium microbalum]|uniref:RIB43A-like with coiled-coils protein 2 n=1 Tax=Synchytrium microbalum TaxID=1806994 RepID=A0A507CAD5_9FUNG|nr:uncharacterized protein SmJEL517_g01472 [Synchytrium microbalum]TPX36129.1 hypothetical protein SmJEL517_g01472 [Synchytrium microbalum]
MYKVEILPSDIKEQAVIERRRRAEEERKNRIFAPKTRQLGIDVDAIAQQVQEKKRVGDMERQRVAAFDRAAKETAQILEALEGEIQNQRRINQRSLVQFHATNQRPEMRREYDLNDPQSLRKDRPARIADNDPRLGASSLQKFEGEDLTAQLRFKEQKQQMKTWVAQQAWERREKERIEREERQQYESFQADVVKRTEALQKAAEDIRAQRAKWDRLENERLANEKRLREMTDKTRDLELNTKEIEGWMNGEFLTERPEVFKIGGGHQLRVDVFKGITETQKRAILATQERQRQENQMRREMERRHEEVWASQQAANLRAAQLLEEERERQHKDVAKRVRNDNEVKAVEDHARQTHLNKVVYTNPPQEGYFSQFNTTSR